MAYFYQPEGWRNPDEPEPGHEVLYVRAFIDFIVMCGVAMFLGLALSKDVGLWLILIATVVLVVRVVYAFLTEPEPEPEDVDDGS